MKHHSRKYYGFDINTKTIVLDNITSEFLKNMRSIRKNLGFTRVYGLSFVEISTMTGWDARTISLAARAKPNASIHCLNDLLQVINKEKTAFAVRQHLTRKKAGDDYA